jgi:signal transduction histidine kinase
VWDVAIITLLIASAFVPFGSPVAPGVQPELVVPSLTTLPWLCAASVIVVVRRRLPVSSLIACLVLFGVVSLLGVATPAFAIPVAVTMYAAALASTRRVTIALGALSAVALPAITVLTSAVPPSGPSIFLSAGLIQFVAIVAFAAALGDATRSRRAWAAAIIERAERAEQSREAEAQRQVAEDRLRIARDLHDTVAHQIAVINLHAESATLALPVGAQTSRESLAIIRTAAREVLAEIGTLLSDLRGSQPPTAPGISTPGLATLDDLIAKFRSTGLEVSLVREGRLDSLPSAIDAVCYLIVQEAMTNAQKHGNGTADLVLKRTDSEIEIRATNPERASASATNHIPGHGLLGTRERIEQIEGSLETSVSDGHFQLVARIPVLAQSPSLPNDAGAS